jgi:hypothetical protein
MSRYTNKRIFQANRTPAAKDILRSRNLTNTRLIETALAQPLSNEERKEGNIQCEPLFGKKELDCLN